MNEVSAEGLKSIIANRCLEMKMNLNNGYVPSNEENLIDLFQNWS